MLLKKPYANDTVLIAHSEKKNQKLKDLSDKIAKESKKKRQTIYSKKVNFTA